MKSICIDLTTNWLKSSYSQGKMNVFFTFFKLYKWKKIAQRIIFVLTKEAHATCTVCSILHIIYKECQACGS